MGGELRAYEQAMSLDSSNRMAAYNLGGILQDNFEEEKAIDCFNRTIQIDPDYADAHYNLGICLETVGRLHVSPGQTVR